MTPEEAEFELVSLLDNSVTLMAPQAHAKGLEIPTFVSPDIPGQLYGDESRIRQILLNLISNAIKFTDSGGVAVTVTAPPLENRPDMIMLRFEIADAGIGIPPEMQDSIFEQFTQVDQTSTRQFGGTGLGLAICKRLVTLMGGEIGVQSRPEGGSLFWFTLRLPRHATTESWSDEAGGSLRDRKILVVDDSPINRLVYEKQLVALGVNVEVARNAETAVEKLRTAADGGVPFDAAIIDHLMPGTDGVELTATIRQVPWSAGLRLVFSSSASMNNTDSGVREQGFNRVLPKPLRPGALTRCVSGLFAEPLADATATATSTASESEAAVPGHGRILLAEDNQINQMLVAAVVKSAGYGLNSVANGLEVLEALRNRPYDLVLMDVQMPEMDGIEATRQIRQLSNENANIPIIGVTAYAMGGDQVRFMQAGMNDYMSKPIDNRLLVEKISFWLGNDDIEAKDSRSDEQSDVSVVDGPSRQARETG